MTGTMDICGYRFLGPIERAADLPREGGVFIVLGQGRSIISVGDVDDLLDGLPARLVGLRVAIYPTGVCGRSQRRWIAEQIGEHADGFK